MNATSPDIDTFRAHGHKLLMYHGWSDWLVAPEESINYYNSVLTRDRESHSSQSPSGARLEPIDDSFRLFMVPGMAHCGGGPGATHFDALGAVVNWVENRDRTGQDHRQQVAAFQSDGAPTLQRPLCPYPRVAQYQGSGSVNDASSFVCTDPNPIMKSEQNAPNRKVAIVTGAASGIGRAMAHHFVKKPAAS